MPAWQQFFSERHRCQFALNALQGLEEDVHPIFNRTNFSCLNYATGLEQPIYNWLHPAQTVPEIWYQRIRPALTLATELLVFSADFFNVVLHGEIEEHKVGENRTRMVYSRQIVEPRTIFTSDLDSVSNIQFFCGGGSADCVESFGMMINEVRPTVDEQNMATVAIQINPEIVAFFGQQNYDTLPQEVKERTLAMLAATLVHELAHAWFAYRRFEVAREGGDVDSSQECEAMNLKDPFFHNTERYNELGFSWEQSAFGGRWDHYSTDDRSDLTLAALNAAKGIGLVGIGKDSDEGSPAAFIHPRLVSALFNKKCWDEFSVYFGFTRAAERIPRLGYAKFGGDNILQQMEVVVTIRTFQEVHGRLPESNELALELVGARLIEALGGYKKKPPQLIEFPPTPPTTPPSELDKKEFPLTPPTTPESEVNVG